MLALRLVPDLPGDMPKAREAHRRNASDALHVADVCGSHDDDDNSDNDDCDANDDVDHGNDHYDDGEFRGRAKCGRGI